MTTPERAPAPIGADKVVGEICCEIDPAESIGKGKMPRRLRAARAAVGLLFLALAVVIASAAALSK